MDALDRLLKDADLRARMSDMGAQIRARDGLRKGADVIEAAARAGAQG